MQQLTPQAQQAIEEMSARFGVSIDAIRTVLDAVNQGGGSMAQFSHPELGGSAQWMSGGMTMVGDMFNNNLKSLVINLCGELSGLLARTQVYPPAPALTGGNFQQQGGYPQQGNNWWPAELGSASSTGGQNDMRYAVFPHLSRLAMERGGQLTVYDTLNHQIGGVQQQNGGVSFSSQFGTVFPEQLPIISGVGSPMAPAPPLMAAPDFPNQSAPLNAGFDNANSGDPNHPLNMLERLAALHKQGLLTDEEFECKKVDLLARI